MPDVNGTPNDDNLIGTDGSDYIRGFAGNDNIDGLAGADILEGGTGNDIYQVDNVDDQVVEAINEGVDEVRSTINYTLSANVERLVLQGIAVSGTGNSSNNTITGNAQANILNGNGGFDTLIGGAGDDYYIISADLVVTDTGYSATNGDQVVELAGEGIDTVETNYGGTLAANVENMILTGDLRATMWGNNLDNHLTGNIADNSIMGGDGNDTLDGGGGADRLDGGNGNDTYIINESIDTVHEYPSGGTDTVLSSINYVLPIFVENLTLLGTAQYATGNFDPNHIIGNDLNNVIDGLGGADTLEGGLGNDLYYVDNAGDVIVESTDAGDDVLVANFSYTLNAGASVETMVARDGTSSINLTGNELGQSIYGNAGANTINGGGGADYLVGGAGNDRYFVDNDDGISELAGGGDDSVFVTDSFSLRAGAEIETIVAFNQDSTAALNLSGNEFGQSLYGSQGANRLQGGGGNDYLVGLGGNDILDGGTGTDGMNGGTGDDLFIVDNDGDTVIEAEREGDDVVLVSVDYVLTAGSSIETVVAADGTTPIAVTGNENGQSIYGNAGNNWIHGGAGSDYLVGNEGNDTLNGGTGNDYLNGGAGSDIFRFTGDAGNDTVLDFTSGTDKIDLSSFGITIDNVAATQTEGGTLLAVDADKDGHVDFTIMLNGSSGPVAADYLF
jgi:Ca2+-binding RTX toxin-like protein